MLANFNAWRQLAAAAAIVLAIVAAVLTAVGVGLLALLVMTAPLWGAPICIVLILLALTV